METGERKEKSLDWAERRKLETEASKETRITIRERKETRIERQREWAEKNEQQAERERQADGSFNHVFKAIELENKARNLVRKAEGTQRQLENTIYSDDPDAVEMLQKKLSGLETQRERIKTINKAIRKAGGLTKIVEENKSTLTDLKITKRELHEISTARKWQGHENGFPPYALSNLSGNINRTKKRIEELQK